MLHDAPHMTVTDPLLLQRFLSRTGINPSQDRSLLIESIAAAFSRIPYENLTKIIKAESVITPRSAMRYPDELISDYLKWGTGGTCFSLTAAIVAVYNALGIEAHPVLADRHYGPDTHCGLVIAQGGQFLLLDPGYLLFVPTMLHKDRESVIQTGSNTIELKPVLNGEKVELYTVYRKNRKLRLTYKITPIDAAQFARAWESSFAWEMMNYPVLTRRSNGSQHYLQGDKLAIYSENDAKRFLLGDDAKVNLIASSFGIDREIINKALGVIKHG